MHKRLRLVRREQTALGLSTIMDRELATTYGVPYVHLAVAAIDVDRVYALDPDRADLPFGWEVFLTEYLLLARIDPANPGDRALVAAVCASVLEAIPGDPPYGSQIVFAVYDAVKRGQLDAELEQIFVTWKRPPEDLVESLAPLWTSATEHAKQFAAHCLTAPLTPPLAAPARAALESLAAG